MKIYTFISTSGNAGFAEMRVHKQNCSQIAREIALTFGRDWNVEATTVHEAILKQKQDFLDQDLGIFDYGIAPCVKTKRSNE